MGPIGKNIPFSGGMNTRFQTSSQADIKTVREARKTKRWWGTFNHEEFYDERVVLFADFLTHGTHTTSYLATAITSGTFSFPPAKAEGMYTPEVFARTESKKIQIK